MMTISYKGFCLSFPLPDQFLPYAYYVGRNDRFCSGSGSAEPDSYRFGHRSGGIFLIITNDLIFQFSDVGCRHPKTLAIKQRRQPEIRTAVVVL